MPGPPIPLVTCPGCFCFGFGFDILIHNNTTSVAGVPKPYCDWVQLAASASTAAAGAAISTELHCEFSGS
eukprot:2177150-Heterocapsa_arctica.AAC.1